MWPSFWLHPVKPLDYSPIITFQNHSVPFWRCIPWQELILNRILPGAHAVLGVYKTNMPK